MIFKIPPFKPDARTPLHIKWALIILIVVSSGLMAFTKMPYPDCLDHGFTAATIAAVEKECWDKWIKPLLTDYVSKFDFWDMVVTIAAAGTGRSILGVGYKSVIFFKSL